MDEIDPKYKIQRFFLFSCRGHSKSTFPQYCWFLTPCAFNYVEISTLWKFSLRFLYVIRTVWIFLTKTWSSDPSYFDTPILDISNTCACASRNYWLLHTIYINMIKSWSLHWGYSLINEAGYQFCQFGNLTFSKNLFWSVNCTLSFWWNYYVRISIF